MKKALVIKCKIKITKFYNKIRLMFNNKKYKIHIKNLKMSYKICNKIFNKINIQIIKILNKIIIIINT